MSDWITNCWPENTARVEAKVRDNLGAYRLPFLVRRGRDGRFRNAETGDVLAVQVFGWRYPESGKIPCR